MERKVAMISAVVAVVIGYLSFLINQPVYNLLLAVVVLIAISFGIKKVFKIDEERNWWFGNVIAIYLFTWFVVWTVFYNIALLG